MLSRLYGGEIYKTTRDLERKVGSTQSFQVFNNKCKVYREIQILVQRVHNRPLMLMLLTAFADHLKDLHVTTYRSLI